MLKEFKQFLLRGNVIDLAVGVVIGGAFGAVVTSFVANILTPLIAGTAKAPNFAGLAITLNGSKIGYGSFLNALLSFLIVASVIFFLVVKPVNHLINRRPVRNEHVKICPDCMTEIPAGAKRCPHCTSRLDGHKG